MSRASWSLLRPGLSIAASLSTRSRIGLSALLLMTMLALGAWPGVQLLEGEKSAQIANVGWFLSAACCVAVLNIYLMLCICTETRGRLQTTSQHLEAMSTGRLDLALPEDGPPEAQQLAQRINNVTQSLRGMVARIVHSSRNVASAGDDMSMSAQTLAIRSDEQSQVIEQTTQAVRDVLAAVQHTADMAMEVDSFSNRLSDQANDSKAVVDNVVAAMGRIKSRTDEMTAALGIIDALTFQTNILALNAAVEAARAGPSGRGFSVVAAEVRALALRTAEAAKGIKETIERSNAEVKQGVTEVNSVKSVIEGVSEGFRDVSRQMRDVSSSNLTQSAAISLISQGLDQLSTITVANTELVANSVGASESLRSSAQELMELVSVLEGQPAPAHCNAKSGQSDSAKSCIDFF